MNIQNQMKRMEGRFDEVVPVDFTVGLSDEQWDRMIKVHLYGAFYGTRAALRHMTPQRRGSVINISSIAAVRATPTRYYYPPVKAALLQVTRSLAVHLAPQQIRVNAIMPGTFRTDMVEKAYSEDQLTETASNTPLGRVADPTELVGPALFLASEYDGFITGATLDINGGVYGA